jgi:hypothetical protein
MPITDTKSAKNLFNVITHFRFSAITDKLVHGSPFAGVILQGIHKGFVRLQTIHISYQQFTSNNELSASDTAINRRCITKYGIGSNRFVVMFHITCRELGTPMLFDSVRNSTARIRGGHFKRTLNGVSRRPTKKRAEQFEVGRSWGNVAKMSNVLRTLSGRNVSMMESTMSATSKYSNASKNSSSDTRLWVAAVRCWYSPY